MQQQDSKTFPFFFLNSKFYSKEVTKQIVSPNNIRILTAKIRTILPFFLRYPDVELGSPPQAALPPAEQLINWKSTKLIIIIQIIILIIEKLIFSTILQIYRNYETSFLKFGAFGFTFRISFILRFDKNVEFFKHSPINLSLK